MERFLYSLLTNSASSNLVAVAQQSHSLLLTAGHIIRSIRLFNTLLRSYSLSDSPQKAFSLYNQLQSLYYFNSSSSSSLQLPSFDSFSYTFLINAATHASSLPIGTQFQGRAIKAGFHSHVYVQTAAMKMYAAAGVLTDALQVFDEMPERNTVSWNVLITGLVRWGELESARSLFDEMPEKNVVTWTGMIDGHVRIGRFGEGLSLLQRMVCYENMRPSEITILAIVPAISHLKDLKVCRLVHCYAEKRGLISFDIRVANSVIDTYAKCGCIVSASRLFEDLRERKNLVSWTTIITGLAMHGLGEEAVENFDRMEKAGWKPNRVTFLSVFNACSHGGLVDHGLKFLEKMVNEYQVFPDIKHYGCLVDMLARLGRLEEAENLALGIPTETANVVIWRTLLGACSFHDNVEMAERVTRKIMEMERGYGGDYVLMHNIFVGAGRFADAEKFRKLMHQRNAIKLPGQSSI